jgi:hypothetical protein
MNLFYVLLFLSSLGQYIVIQTDIVKDIVGRIIIAPLIRAEDEDVFIVLVPNALREKYRIAVLGTFRSV